MQLTPTAASPLAIDDALLWRLFEPFTDRSAGEVAWTREARRRKWKLSKNYLRRRLLGRLTGDERSEQVILDEYEKSWSGTEYDRYSLDRFPRNDFIPWVWRDRRFFATDVGGTRFRQLMLIRAIELTRPRSVLEIGCGNGINLILLACRFPEVSFTGLELTEAGQRAARGFQERHATLPDFLCDFAPEPLPDPLGFKRIRFERGSAAELPFADGSFDFVQTVLALEQMEQIRARALGEMARVTAGHSFNIEPFRDVNTGWSRLYVERRNYFRGGIDELSSLGVEPQWAAADFPQELFLKAAAVLSKKRG
jgi:SAM-dependent methyltransferase